ncbi:MAG: DUF368 domain-containing protein [Coprobacillus sp.]|nr:DUF368 domain-containing protein [Coprobacillus sp.]
MRVRLRNFVKRLLSGLLMGISAAIPGISGGTTAVILQIYDDIVDAVNHFFKKFKNAMIVLIPVLIGVIIGLIPCFYLFDLALEYFAFGLICIFAGLIIGCFPSLTDQVKGAKVRPTHIVSLIVAFAFSLSIGVISVQFSLNEAMADVFANPQWWFYLIILGVGLLASFSVAVPGISGSMLLLILGLYDNIVNYFVDFFRNISSVSAGEVGQFLLVILMIVIGFIIGVWGISKLMSIFLKHWRVGTYYAIIGFVAGSLVTLFYNNNIVEYYQMWASGSQGSVSMTVEIIIGVALLMVSIVIGYLLITLYRRRVKINEEKIARYQASLDNQPTNGEDKQ